MTLVKEHSRSVSTNQSGVHRDLERIVGRHLKAPWQKPINRHTQGAFAMIREWVDDEQCSLIVDSCCGDGESTRVLARQFSTSKIIGVDKSAARLGRGANRLDPIANCLMVRADVNDFWRLIVAAKWRVSQHYILYPNPYPKAAHLRKRWYGSPALPVLVAMGGSLVVRSNWQTYIEEFSLALKVAGVASSWQQIEAEDPMTSFERKYAASGQALWQLNAALPVRD